MRLQAPASKARATPRSWRNGLRTSEIPRGPQRGWPRGHGEMGWEREKYAEAEDFERMLAADDRRLQPAGPQDRPVPRHKTDYYECQSQKKRKTQKIEN